MFSFNLEWTEFSFIGVGLSWAKNKYRRPCDGCGMTLPSKSAKKIKASTTGDQLFCRTCAKVCNKCITLMVSLLSFICHYCSSVLVLCIFSQLHEYLFQLMKSKHFCGICKKVWNHSDGGSWVRLSFIYFRVLAYFISFGWT